MKRKVIFIDIDGVLNSDRNQLKNEEQGRWRSQDIILDKEAMCCLKQIVGRTGAELILSSTWRYEEYDGSFASKDSFVRQLAEHGMSLAGQTPLVKYYDRAREIQEWLNMNTDVNNFIIIDDDIDLLRCEKLKQYVVHTIKEEGLTKEEIEKAIRLINR